MFQKFLVNTRDQEIPLSNTIELWDVLPIYSVTLLEQNKRRTKEGLLPLLELNISFLGSEYIVSIKPAQISMENGKAYYPSANEELIESALRKIAAMQNCGFYNAENANCGVHFTLYQLKRELRNQGHTRSSTQIIKSLHILGGAGIEIRSKNRQAISIGSYMTISGFSKDSRLDNPNSRWVAIFHPLVYKAMSNLAYRQFNYQIMMGLKPQLARWLFKRAAHYYTNASLLNPLCINLSTIIAESGLLNRERAGNSLIELEGCFNALVEANVFSRFERAEDIRVGRNRIHDIRYKLIPHADFIKSVKAANKRQSDDRESLPKPSKRASTKIN
ncbi:hypothetical protein [Methylomonas sp. AM2-LC]|uniref:hypothetical protein n=1 Tax=Methylomonas sp. AM2-LC TaxID=3153301 RepID=UPI003264AF4C